MEKSNTTLVSAFFSSPNIRHRNIEEYIEYGKKIINIQINKIIFIEKKIYDEYFIDENVGNNTIFFYIDVDDIYLYQHYDKITDFKVNTDNPTKDTIDYMLIMCNKTEFLRKAIEKNPYDSEQFIWVDFGIYHTINNDEAIINSITSLMDKKYDNIRIGGGVYYENNITDENIYSDICWCFLGSIFGGNKDKIIEFADLMKEKCLSIIYEKKTIMWEINIWYLIYKENPDLFSIYLANHNLSMILFY